MVKVKIDKEQDIIKQGYIKVSFTFPHICNGDVILESGRRIMRKCSICGRIND